MSYLLQYSNNGQRHTIFVLASIATRRSMKEWIDQYGRLNGAEEYTAVELEKDQADCFIHTKDKVVSLKHEGFNVKPDHYLVTAA